ncbi:hypothetical protein [Pseudoponticoccus marisrubri]|nr:hypothetical protein [Pseudoponticoccus marisrubri]
MNNELHRIVVARAQRDRAIYMKAVFARVFARHAGFAHAPA